MGPLIRVRRLRLGFGCTGRGIRIPSPGYYFNLSNSLCNNYLGHWLSVITTSVSYVQSKMVCMRSGKPMCAPTCLRSISSIAYKTVPVFV